MNALSVSAVVFTSPDPCRLADFYRTHLGIPIESSSHGPLKDHQEGWLGDPARGGVHIAVLKGPGPGPKGGGPAPTFRVRGLDACVAELEAAGTRPAHKIAELGEGKRMVSFRDPDGNIFRLIDLGF
jgi:catechol 2,3-dioxygenase-like lactoylglutathione lyase family enzyme